MIGSRSCSNHENCSVDRAHSSGIGLLCIRGDRISAVRSEGADADRAGGPVRHGIGSIALRPGGRRAANRGRRSALGEPLRSAGAHDTWPAHREHFLVSPAPVPHGCGYSGRGCDFVGDRRVLSPPVLRRAICSEVSVAHLSWRPQPRLWQSLVPASRCAHLSLYSADKIGAPTRWSENTDMAQEKLRVQSGDYMAKAEVIVYSVLGILLFMTALATIANAGKMLWLAVGHWTIATDTLLVLDQLLVVLMMVEIMHTVRISIHSHVLVTEPFLVVGLIASIRRMLVITLEAASLTKGGVWSADGASIFRGSMMELGLLGLVILILVFSITLLRRYAPEKE